MGLEIVFEDKISAAKKAVSSIATERMLMVANEVRNITVETLSGARSGKTYLVPGTKKTYTASAPGEPPAVQVGDLRESIKYGTEDEGKGIVAYVGTKLLKGPMLEYGTSNMAARPWLRVSFEKAKAKVKNILERKWF
jgi:hypothetical protein